VPAVLLAFSAGGFGLAAFVVGLFIIIQQFEAHLIYPLVVRKVVGVPPVISILALVIGAKLAGFLGIILAVPLATVVMVFIEDLEKKKINPAPSQ
ncbi:MAG TPA: AI-2E family transporter, partial [Candidatus Paceibacterota bacterium]